MDLTLSSPFQPAHPPSPRVGLHEFAHMRAVAQGVPLAEAARRYLGIVHGAEALNAHRRVVDRISAIARRRRDPRWRLLGLTIPTDVAAVNQPSIDEWAAAEGLEDFAVAELQDMYAERFAGSVQDPAALRRFARNGRLAERRLQLLLELERQAAVRPSLEDAVDGWIEPRLAKHLQGVGLSTLGAVRDVIRIGGQWWSRLGIRGFGRGKAERLAAQLHALLGEAHTLVFVRPRDAVQAEHLSGRKGSNRTVGAFVGTDATDDHAAMRRWVEAVAGSEATARAYSREGTRFLLWIVMERRKALSDATAEDCAAYLDFLKRIPPQWISRRRAAPFTPGWAPFAGQLSHRSRQQAITIVTALFEWLTSANYLRTNPWNLVNTRLGDPRLERAPKETSRAFTPEAWKALQDQLHRDMADEKLRASAMRMRWILWFVEACGLRADELVNARRGDIQPWGGGLGIHVHGKGARNRWVAAPSVAINETKAYFNARGIDFELASESVPLLAVLRDPVEPMTYASLYKTFKAFVRRTARNSALPAGEQAQIVSSSMHWLRHTHATRAAERDVPADILQANLGQSDPRTTATYYKAQAERRRRAMEQAFEVRPDGFQP